MICRFLTQITIQFNPAASVCFQVHPTKSLRVSSKHIFPTLMYLRSRYPMTLLILITSTVTLQALPSFIDTPSRIWKMCFEAATWQTGWWTEASALDELRRSCMVPVFSGGECSQASTGSGMNPTFCITSHRKERRRRGEQGEELSFRGYKVVTTIAERQSRSALQCSFSKGHLRLTLDYMRDTCLPTKICRGLFIFVYSEWLPITSLLANHTESLHLRLLQKKLKKGR